MISAALAFVPESIIDEGWAMIIPVVIGSIVLIIISRSDGKYPVNFFESHKKMTWQTFLGFFGLLFLIQGITQWVMYFVESLGVSGTSLDYDFDSFSFILYAGIIGPIGEELVFRGFVQGNLKQSGAGKVWAIVLTSIAFGLMHGNLYQFVLASLMGLVFGYIGMEYSIWWTLLMHFINNFVLGYGFELLVPAEFDMIISNLLFALFGAMGIAICWFRRDILKEFFRDNDSVPLPGFARELSKSIWFWIYTAIYVAIIILLMIFGGLL